MTCNKYGFHEERKATAAVSSALLTGKRMRHYACDICGRWHVAPQTKKRRKRAYVGPWYRDRCFTRDGYRCVRCESTENLTIDHIVPVSHGGSRYSLSNHQTLCYACNQAKADSVISYLAETWV